MTDYPGHDPRPDDPGRPDGDSDSGTTEPTRPITPSGPAWNPSSAQPGGPGQGYTPPPPPPQPTYPPQDSGQPYGQPYGQSYGRPPSPPQPPQPYAPAGQYGQPYGAPAYGYGPVRQHPRATTSMVLGIIGLVSLMVCGVGLVVSPVAWILGHGALRDIRSSHGQLGGEGSARAGQVMGIIGTILLVLGVVVLVVIIVAAVTSGSSDVSFDSGTST